MHFINALLSCGAFPFITKPTRVTDTTATIIDHIITNVTNHKILPGVIETSEVSDQYPIFCQVQNITLPKKNNNFIGYYRDKSKFYSDAFNYDLFNALNFYFVNLPNTTNNNFDVVFNGFTRIVLQITDRHAPIKKISRRQKKLLKKPWITKALLVSIKKKHVLFKMHYVNGNNSQKSYYKQYLNKLTKIKTISKKLYFEKEFHLNRDNPKKTWDIIKTLLPSNSKSCNNTQNLHNIAFDNLAKLAEQFNEFFSTIGEQLSNKIPTYQANHFQTYLAKRVSESMFLEPTNITEIVNTILSLNVNKAVGYDNIPAY